MENLFWKTKDTTKGLLATPFNSEAEFEEMIFNTPEILEDIFLIKRQVRGGNKSGVPDIIGIDYDGNICIVEMKNVTVDASIIPQVLQYAIWAETNPDSIKNLWLEHDNKPDLHISWDDFQVRIIIIAPSILRSTLDIVNKINYPVDLIEIKRWVEGENQLLLVNKLEEEKTRKPKPVSGMEPYGEEFYKKEYNKDSASEFIKYVREVESIINENNWKLETKFNKYYCGFKAGAYNAFGIKWIGTKTFAFFFKLEQNQVDESPIKLTKYDAQWKEALYYVDPRVTKTRDFIPLFEASYKKLTGK
ncbi:MAG: hypothetical protein GX244_02435 [Firmicutes bacterium]|jgi:hypothetical protein|nr:hypothetical protein [Bacillota bacterium]